MSHDANTCANDRTDMIASPTVQEYLEALHNLEQAGRPVRPSSLAHRLGVSSSAVTDMLKRLRAEGLVDRTPDQGVVLTESGRRAASRMVRRHRLAERFLVDILGLPWYGAHEEACKLEHALSAESEEGLARLLGNADTCPHGNPIPDTEGNLIEKSSRPMAELQPGEHGCIVKITNENREDLQYLATLGLLPGVEVVVEEKSPFGGPVLISVGRSKYALGREIANDIWIGEERQRDYPANGQHRHRHGHHGGHLTE